MGATNRRERGVRHAGNTIPETKTASQTTNARVNTDPGFQEAAPFRQSIAGLLRHDASVDGVR
jgi:hypothetical protein